MTGRPTPPAKALHSRRAWLAAGAGVYLAGRPGGVFAQGHELVDVIARLRRSVMPVGTFSPTASPRFGFRGTGFAVGDGTLIATCAHVLHPDEGLSTGPRMAVLMPDTGDKERPDLRLATIEAVDRQRDLALLRLEGRPLAPLTLAEEGEAREGLSIGVLGFPIGGTLGFAPVTHRGIVASITSLALPAVTAAQLDPRAATRLREGNFEILQLDATAYPGNSGGPVFDASTGKVLGVLNMVLAKASRESALSNPTGISYAIPARQLRALMAEGRPPR